MPMYFVQHGLAVPESVDSNRPLSADGREEVGAVAAHLRKAGVSVKKVFHSGKTRAKETAQILSGQIADGKIHELPGMSPNDDVIEFAKGLNEDNAMYVGHLPHLGKLVSYLIAGDEHAGVVKFVNAGVVCVEKDSTGCHIGWYLKPSMCTGTPELRISAVVSSSGARNAESRYSSTLNDAWGMGENFKQKEGPSNHDGHD